MTSGLSIVGRGGAIDQQRFGGAAHAGAAHLGVEHDLLRHVEVGGLVDVDVARRLPDARTPARAPRPARAPTRPLPPRGTITSMSPSRPASISPTAARSRVGTSWIASSGKLGGAQALDQRRMDRARGAEALRAAAQDHGIAGLEAEHGRHPPSRSGGSRRSRRRRRAARARARWSCRSAASSFPSRRRPDRRARARPRCRPPWRRRACASSESRSRNAACRAGGLRLGDILGVGGEDCRPRCRGSPAPWRRAPRRAAPPATSASVARRALRAAADVGHRGGDAGAFDGFQGAVMAVLGVGS